MSRTLFIDGFAGAAGDMLLGAMFDAGLDFDRWLDTMGGLALPPTAYTLAIGEVRRQGIRATKLTVYINGVRADSEPHDHAHEPHDHPHGHVHAPHHEYLEPEPRGLLEIRQLLADSYLPAPARALAGRIFERLAIAEARVHGVTPEQVHFHEVGAVDALVDIVGFAVAHAMLAPDRTVVAPLVTGSGTVRCAHGLLPVPVPAVVELLRESKAPQAPTLIHGEALTPTGAAILTTVADAYQPMVAFQQLEASGYGAGTRDPEDQPNVLRVMWGEV